MGRQSQKRKKQYLIRESAALIERMNAVGCDPTSDIIVAVPPDSVNILFDKAYETAYQRGLQEQGYFSYPVELLRLHTACIYTAACCESGPETRKAIEHHVAELAKAVIKVEQRIKEMESIPWLSPNETLLQKVAEKVNAVKKQANTYIAAMADQVKDKDLVAAREAKNKLRDIAADHSEIFAQLRDFVSDANKRGREREEHMDLIGELAIKYKDAKTTDIDAGIKIYSKLSNNEILSPKQERAKEALGVYFEPNSIKVRQSEIENFRKFISRNRWKVMKTMQNSPNN